ncbi:mediator of RNA polymerase II transcription subunit 15-like isoform X2 [Tigriopus californicus]|uniref:mediator of RNA polymerase II transcription subunit 15-like isoform X2 n=1 Tax=Tigriopus californicus TaxID=6832 RepID=UPI0027DA4315|nr:mediator of RNA polymerase II transcription subunit 15-like isoform X2 [Tigriopus californicus]
MMSNNNLAPLTGDLALSLDQSWKTEQFRCEAVQKLTQAFQESQRGSNRTLGNGKQAEELEKSICKKAESQRQYLELLEKCINVVRRMGQQQQQQQQQQQHQQQQPQPQHLPQPPQQQPVYNSSGGGIVTSVESRPRSTNAEMMGDHRHASMSLVTQPEPGMNPGNNPAASQLQQRLLANRGMPGPGNPMMTNLPPNMAPRGINMGQMMPNRMGNMGGMGPAQPMGNPMMNQTSMGPSMGQRAPPPMYNVSPHIMTPGGSPANMGMMSQSPVAGQYIHSPQQAPIPSPAGGGGPRSMAPSPLSSANTPNPQDTSSTQDEQAYLEKVRQLAKYIEPLRIMISRIGSSDQVKLDKMKKLLDILSNPNKRMPIETLKKCEDVLVRLKLDTEVRPESTVNPLLEAVYNLRTSSKTQSVHLNHTLQRTFGAPLEALYGPEISLPPLPKRRRVEEESPSDIPHILQGEVARLQSHFKVQLDQSQPTQHVGQVNLTCQLEDPNLPSVPPISVTIPEDYPDVPPICDADLTEYFATPFLQRVQTALTSRLSKMPPNFTLSQLLSAWEFSVRSACSPKPNHVTIGTAIFGM